MCSPIIEISIWRLHDEHFTVGINVDSRGTAMLMGFRLQGPSYRLVLVASIGDGVGVGGEDGDGLWSCRCCESMRKTLRSDPFSGPQGPLSSNPRSFGACSNSNSSRCRAVVGVVGFRKVSGSSRG
jgi:hypothetical protein